MTFDNWIARSDQYRWWKKSQTTTWHGAKNPVNHGISYQTQLVSQISEPSTVSPRSARQGQLRFSIRETQVTLQSQQCLRHPDLTSDFKQRWTVEIWMIWVFPKIGVPQKGWFTMENPYKKSWLGGTPIFGNTHLLGISRDVKNTVGMTTLWIGTGCQKVVRLPVSMSMCLPTSCCLFANYVQPPKGLLSNPREIPSQNLSNSKCLVTKLLDHRFDASNHAQTNNMACR